MHFPVSRRAMLATVSGGFGALAARALGAGLPTSAHGPHHLPRATCVFADHMNAGWIVRNSFFLESYQCTPLIPCGPGLFENNRIERAGNWVRIHPGEVGRLEGGIANGVIFRDNVFVDCFICPSTPGFNVNGQGSPLSDLTLEGNLICNAGREAVQITFAEDVVLKNNIVVNPFEGRDLMPEKECAELPAFHLKQVTGATIEDNIVVRRDASTAVAAQRSCSNVGERNNQTRHDPAETLEERIRELTGTYDRDARAILKEVRAELKAGQPTTGASKPTASTSPPTQPLFFTPDPTKTGYLWDVWLTVHEGRYYLYYLASKEPGRAFDNIGLALSDDGVNWTGHGTVVPLAPESYTMGSCGVWPSVGEGLPKFIMNLTEGRNKQVEYGMPALGSDDLIHWRRLDAKHDFLRDTRWYEPDGRWVGISPIPHPDGGYYGYWSANAKAGAKGLFGFGRSVDGLNWEALPPPETEGLARGGVRELGGAAVINGKVYLLYCAGQGEMTVFVGDRPEGPFRIQEKNARVLFGHTHFARFADSGDGSGPLVVHHVIGSTDLDTPPRSSFAPIKRAIADDEGILRLTYWEGNDRLKTKPVEVQLDDSAKAGPGSRMRMVENEFNPSRGLILEGRFAKMKGTRFLSLNQGLYVETSPGRGVGIMVIGGLVRLGTIRSDATGFRMDSFVNRQWSPGPEKRFRLLLRDDLLEFYLNDHLMQSYALPEPATGRLGIIHNGDPDCVDQLKAWN